MGLHVGVFGHYGNGNLGDEAITEAATQSAFRLLDADKVTLFSIVPADSASRHNLDAYPIRRGRAPVAAGAPKSPPSTPMDPSPSPSTPSALKRFLKRIPGLQWCVDTLQQLVALPSNVSAERKFLADSKQALSDVDVLLVCGSNQFLDNFGGVWGFPYTIWKWARLCRATNTQLAFLSIGAGPITNPLSFWMIRKAIQLSIYHSYRDPGSLHLVESENANLGGVIAPDLACNLIFPEQRASSELDSLKIALNPMPVYGDYWFIRDEQRYRAYLNKLADFAEHVAKRQCRLTLFPTQTRDRDAIRDLLEILRSRNTALADSISVADTQKTQDVMAVIQDADVIVPTRFHGAILGILGRRPVIGVCYQKKALEALAAAGQEQYALMLDDFDSSELNRLFDELVAEFATVQQQISSRADIVREEINEQYRQVRRRLPAT
ncbi:MAG: polysaccharide pyruvyl transferase family protein [Pseudomonadota bacterium]